MKKQLAHIGLGILFLLPVYGHAEEVSSTTLPQTVKEIKEVSTSDASSSPSVASTTPKSFTECSQEAIESRDTSIASSRTIYNNAMTNALKDRKNKEKAAVAIKDENEKKDAIKASVNTYKTLVKNAQTNLTQARKLAWTTFEDDIKKCHDIEDALILDQQNDQNGTSSSDVPTIKKMEEGESKTIKDTINSVLRSLFN